MIQLKIIQEISKQQQKVLLRADLNIPIKDGIIGDTTRIQKLKPTIQTLLENKHKVAIISHFGRPKGKRSDKFSLKQIITTLENELEIKIIFINDCLNPEIPHKLEELKNNEILLLENTRFYPEEKENSSRFAKLLANPFDIFVNDAFGSIHRGHASTLGVTKFLPSYAGKLIQDEIKNLEPLLHTKHKLNFTLVLGGAKIDTKTGIIDNFIGKADKILIGGALANTFLAAQGYDIGQSLIEKDKIEIARQIMLKAEKAKTNIYLPTDVIVADEVNPNSPKADIPCEDVEANMTILDIGQNTIHTYSQIILDSKLIISNGPMGLYEFLKFSQGTNLILTAINKSKGKSYLGGGDTLDAILKLKIPTNDIAHISTGGGAMIEFLEEKKLPGLTPLLK